MIEIPDLDELSLHNYSASNNVTPEENHSEDESQQPPQQQQQHFNHNNNTSTTTFHPLTTDRGEWLSSTPTKPITSVYATTTTQYTNPRAAYHLRLYQRSIAAIGNFFQNSTIGSDILGETIALYNSLANSSNIHKPQPQLPQESSDHLTQKETSKVSASPHPMLDQAPQMIDARLERIEHEVDNFNERKTTTNIHKCNHIHKIQNQDCLSVPKIPKISAHKSGLCSNKNSSLEFDAPIGLVYMPDNLMNTKHHLNCNSPHCYRLP